MICGYIVVCFISYHLEHVDYCYFMQTNYKRLSLCAICAIKMIKGKFLGSIWNWLRGFQRLGDLLAAKSRLSGRKWKNLTAERWVSVTTSCVYWRSARRMCSSWSHSEVPCAADIDRLSHQPVRHQANVTQCAAGETTLARTSVCFLTSVQHREHVTAH